MRSSSSSAQTPLVLRASREAGRGPASEDLRADHALRHGALHVLVVLADAPHVVTRRRDRLMDRQDVQLRACTLADARRGRSDGQVDARGGGDRPELLLRAGISEIHILDDAADALTLILALVVREQPGTDIRSVGVHPIHGEEVAKVGEPAAVRGGARRERHQLRLGRFELHDLNLNCPVVRVPSERVEGHKGALVRPAS